MFNTVKIQGDGFLVDGKIYAPAVDGNPFYEEIKEHIANGGVVESEFTQADLDAQAIAAKWQTYSEYCNTLTVQRPEALPIELGFKFSADPQSLANISLEIDTMLDADTRVWYEDWGSATVTKQDLQEAKQLASEAKQAKLTELFGA